jgi:Transcriptional regulator
MANLELYRIFNAVVEAGTITKASLNLNISQPAVTKHIKNLESELDGTLFVRTKSGMILNEQGSELYIYSKQALSLIDIGEKKFRNLGDLEKGTIKIGISTTLTRKYLFKYIKIFRKLYPNIIVDISTDSTSELIEKLKKGKIDFVVSKFSKIRDSELDYKAVGYMQDIFVVNEEYKKLINRKVKIEELLEYPLLVQTPPSNSRNTINSYYQENNLELNPAMNIASSNLLVDFVKAGYGIGFITKEYIDNELNDGILYAINVVPKISANEFGIIRLKNNILPFSAAKFLEVITDVSILEDK